MSALQEPPGPEPGVRVGICRSLGRRLAGFFRPHAAACVRFLRLAWPGAAIGLIVAALFLPTYGGLCMGTGLGTAIDVMGSLLLGPIDLTIELAASNGEVVKLPLSHVHPIQPILKVTFTKWPYWERTHYRSATEPVLQTFEIPLSDFTGVNPALDPALLKQVPFRFDRTKSAVIILDHAGFAQAR